MRVEIQGSRLAPPRVEELRRAGTPPEPTRVYAVAATQEVVNSAADAQLGRIDSRREDVLLREATVAFLRARGFAGLQGEQG